MELEREEEEEHWIIEVWTWRLDRGSMSGTGFNPGLANIDLENDFRLGHKFLSRDPELLIAPSKILSWQSFT